MSVPGQTQKQKQKHVAVSAASASIGALLFEEDGSINLDTYEHAKARLQRAQEEAAAEAEADFLRSAQSRVGHRGRHTTAREQELVDDDAATDARSAEENAARSRAAWMTMAGISRSTLVDASPTKSTAQAAVVVDGRSSSKHDARRGTNGSAKAETVDAYNEDDELKGHEGMMRERAAAERWIVDMAQRSTEARTKQKHPKAMPAAAPSDEDYA